MTRHINAEGLKLIKQWEGLRLDAYRDVVGVWTIGYGSTGPHVKPGAKVTEAQAEALLLTDLARFERCVDTSVRVALSDNQFAALVAFAFNIGEAAFKGSTLLKHLNKGGYDAVPAELAKWVKGTDPKTGKKVTVNGLVNRRAAEAGLWAKGAFVASNTVEAKPAAPPILTVDNLVKVATPAAALVQGFTSGAAQIVLAVGFVLGAAYLAWRWSKRQQEASA